MYLVDRRLGNYTKMDPECLFTLSESNRYWTGGIPEAGQIDWMCTTFGSKDAVALDIGAHCGTWTLSLAKSFARVFAFEPNDEVHNILCANLALGQHKNVSTSHKALSSSRGSARYFFRSDDGGGNGIENLCAEIDAKLATRMVKKISLDEYLESRESVGKIAFIKIDVEGHELDVLKGARGTIERHKPAIVLESWCEWREKDGIPAISLRQALFDYIGTELGYAIRPIVGHNEMFLCTPLVQNV